MSTSLHKSMLAYWEGTDQYELQASVWRGTPWMIDVYTGSTDSDRYYDLRAWCAKFLGERADPFRKDPRQGNWHWGGATFHGQTWIGFATEDLMHQFEAQFPDWDKERS